MGLVVFAIALWAQTDALLGVFYDDGIYASLARSLAAGEGYVNGHVPGAPVGVHYPPLYPWALSLLWRVWPAFPANVALFELFDAACLGVAGWMLARHARRLPLSPWVSGLMVLLGCTAFPVLAVVGVRFSEPLFLALAAGALLTGDRAGRTWRDGLAAGGLAGLATLTRSIGLAVLLGVVVGFVVRRRPRAAVAALAGGLVLIAPWIIWTLRHAGGMPDVLSANYGTYVSELGQAGIGGVITSAAFGGLWPLGRLLLPPLPALLAGTLTLALWGLIVRGGFAAWRVAPALVVTLAGYVAITLLWPYAPDRFLWIVLPWLLLLLAVGIVHVVHMRAPLRVAVAALAVVLIVAGGFRQARALSQRTFATSATAISEPFRLLTAVIQAETPPDAVLAGADEALLSLYTNRLAVPAHLFRREGREPRPLDAAASLEALCDFGVTLIAVTGPGDPASGLVNGLEPHFQIRDGPGLYRLTCPH